MHGTATVGFGLLKGSLQGMCQGSSQARQPGSLKVRPGSLKVWPGNLKVCTAALGAPLPPWGPRALVP